jgi:hypothetical protein
MRRCRRRRSGTNSLWSQRRSTRSRRSSGSGNGWRSRCSGSRRNGRRRPGRTHPRRFGRGFLGFFFRFGFGFRLSLSFGLAQQVFANFFRDVFGNGTRVGLLLGYSIPGQKVNNGFRLDLQFACQLVDSDLISFAHASYRPFCGQNSIAPASPGKSFSHAFGSSSAFVSLAE